MGQKRLRLRDPGELGQKAAQLFGKYIPLGANLKRNGSEIPKIVRFR